MDSRYQQVNKEIKANQEKLSLNSAEGREVMHLALLAQISETFGMFLDIYAATHGVGVQLSVPEQKDEKTEQKLKQLKKMAKNQKKDDKPIPDSEIPFASDE